MPNYLTKFISKKEKNCNDLVTEPSLVIKKNPQFVFFHSKILYTSILAFNLFGHHYEPIFVLLYQYIITLLPNDHQH